MGVGMDMVLRTTHQTIYIHTCTGLQNAMLNNLIQNATASHISVIMEMSGLPQRLCGLCRSSGICIKATNL